MLVVTTNDIPGRRIISVLGLVQGSTVQSKHIGRDIGASIKSIVGGEITGYSEMMEEARTIAAERMVREAEMLGANAVVGMRYQTSTIMGGASEVIAYGTAVIID